MEKKANSKIPAAHVLLFGAVLLYYSWIAAQIPYTHDDWAWGIQTGLGWFLEASTNSRYAGNAIVILLTRSPVLKTVVMGITFTLIPIVSVKLVKTIEGRSHHPEGQNNIFYLFFLANILMLVIPTNTWMQTFGWVAGFSNYVTVSLSTLIYLLIIINVKDGGKKRRTLSMAFLFFFAIIMQLFVENITVCTMILTTIVCIRSFVKTKEVQPELIILFIGNLIGTVIMFSSPIYTTLLETGTAVDGIRKLEINKESGFLSETTRLIRFFLYYYPNQIWSSNVWMCCYICVSLLVIQLKEKKRYLCVLGALVDTGFLVYFLYTHFYGKVQLLSSWWTDLFSAGMNLLFFLIVLLQCIALFNWKEKNTKYLLFFWIAAPAVMLPLVVVVTGGGRCCLPTQMLQMLFCLMLTEKTWDCCKNSSIRKMGLLFILLSILVWINMGKIYFDIGEVKRIRDHDISLAQNRLVNRIQLSSFPHGEYLWNPDPLYGSENVSNFKEFYKIPDDVELWFDTW